MRFQMYLASPATGQKISGYTFVDADDIRTARARFRSLNARKKIDWGSVEILAEI